uniref:Uncharacterized protein n=1 Tax=viral metagenome TaxID=1070528 RepID=A0A6C0JZC8_9ZZZZ
MNLLHTAEFYLMSKLIFSFLMAIVITLSLRYKLSTVATYSLVGGLFVLYIGSEYLVVSDLNRRHDLKIATLTNWR